MFFRRSAYISTDGYSLVYRSSKNLSTDGARNARASAADNAKDAERRIPLASITAIALESELYLEFSGAPRVDSIPAPSHPSLLQPSALSPHPFTLTPSTSTLTPQPSTLTPHPVAPRSRLDDPRQEVPLPMLLARRPADVAQRPRRPHAVSSVSATADIVAAPSLPPCLFLLCIFLLLRDHRFEFPGHGGCIMCTPATASLILLGGVVSVH